MELVHPVLLTKCVSVQPGDWCRSGTSASTTTMTAAPARCHHAETADSSRTRLTPKALSRPCISRMTQKHAKVVCGVTSTPIVRSRKAIQVVAAPKSTAAVTATSPRKLNQPVNQAHSRLFFLASRPAQK